MLPLLLVPEIRQVDDDKEEEEALKEFLSFSKH